MNNSLLNTRLDLNRESLKIEDPGNLLWPVREMKLNRAVELARSGRLDQALEELSGFPEDGSDAEALSLRAKILAQKGRLVESRSCWEKALAKDPSNEDFQRGLRYVEKRSTPAGVNFLSGRVIGIILAGVILVLAALFVNFLFTTQNARLDTLTGKVGEVVEQQEAILNSKPAEPAAITAAPTERVDLAPVTRLITDSSGEIKSGQQAILDRLNALENRMPAPAVPAEPSSSEKFLAESGLTGIKGVSAVSQDGHINVAFTDGLFQYSYVLRDRSLQKIVSIGKALEPYAGKIRVNIRGYRSAGEGDDFINLEYLRAVVLGNYFIKNTGLPQALFTFSGNNGVSLYPNDTWENIQRNKTCVITVELIQ